MKLLSRLLALCLVISMTACGGDDNDEDEPTPVTPSSSSLITGTYPYLYPLFYWDKTPSYIKGKEARTLYKDEVSGGDGSISYYGSGNVALVMYSFEDNKLEACGMAVTSSYKSAFISSLKQDFTSLGYYDGYNWYLSNDETIIAGGSNASSSSSYIMIFMPYTGSSSKSRLGEVKEIPAEIVAAVATEISKMEE
ncbi:MAG: hypothetical protein LIP02_11715 [Bacteroidales bacterium]|nr:hypothetical protein [Bacteroidales bacterium]